MAQERADEHGCGDGRALRSAAAATLTRRAQVFVPFLRKGLCVIDTDMLRLSFEDTGACLQRCAAL